MILPILQKWGVTSAVALAKVAETRRIASKVSLRSHLKRHGSRKRLALTLLLSHSLIASPDSDRAVNDVPLSS